MTAIPTLLRANPHCHIAMRQFSAIVLVVAALAAVAVRAVNVRFRGRHDKSTDHSRQNATTREIPSFHIRHAKIPYLWSPNCPSPMVLGWKAGAEKSQCCCSILDYEAIGDNSTLNTIAIQSTIDECHSQCFRDASFFDSDEIHRTVVVYVPKGMFRTGSLSLRSNLRFHIAQGGAIYGSDDPSDYPVVPMLPDGYDTHKSGMFRALLSGYHVENVSITGENYGYPPRSLARFSSATATRTWNDTKMSVIDGVGWKWWCKAGSMPIVQPFCQALNPHNETLPESVSRPKLVEFHNSSNIVLDRFTARNSPFWFLHPFESKNIAMTNLTVLAPRAVGNTDGLDPDSCENVLMDSCYMDVGDDGVSIKSTNHSGRMMPTRNITMRNLRIVSRNWCIGSATFGGIYDILFEDSTIGDLETVTSPWAIKFKSHRYYPGPMENITIRNIEIGKMGSTPWMYPEAAGSAFLIHLSYGEPIVPDDQRSGKPLFRNVTLQNISVASANVAGSIQGFPENCLVGLSLKNISIKGGSAKWKCGNVDLDSLEISNVHPPVSCKGGCVNASDDGNHAFTEEQWIERASSDNRLATPTPATIGPPNSQSSLGALG